jgi:hypothetical protein
MSTAERQDKVITKSYKIGQRRRYVVHIHRVRMTQYGLFSIGILETHSFDWSDDADKFISDSGLELRYL